MKQESLKVKNMQRPPELGLPEDRKEKPETQKRKDDEVSRLECSE